MAIPAEHLYESCTCESGMRSGRRCADCGGRGILPRGIKPTGAAVEPEAPNIDDEPSEEESDDGLEQLAMAELRDKARELGLSAGGGREALVERIREASAAGDEEGDDDGA